MDFVAKTAFQSKLKKLGEDMGVKDVFGDNSIFQSNSTTEDTENQSGQQRENEQEEAYPPNIASYFASLPNNFPPVVNLFYIDRSILSYYAIKPIQWTFRVCITNITLYILNIITRIVFQIMRRSKEPVVNLILSIVFAFLMSFIHLFGYDLSFRGAYQTNKNLRVQYLAFSTFNIIIILLYTFVGVAWFNGWSKVARINAITGLHPTNRTIITILCVIESLCWTMVLFASMYTAFEYYTLYRDGHHGLSQAARHEANVTTANGNHHNNAPPSSSETTNTEAPARHPPSHVQNAGNQRQFTRDARIQQIKDKYTGQSS